MLSVMASTTRAPASADRLRKAGLLVPAIRSATKDDGVSAGSTPWMARIAVLKKMLPETARKTTEPRTWASVDCASARVSCCYCCYLTRDEEGGGGGGGGGRYDSPIAWKPTAFATSSTGVSVWVTANPATTYSPEPMPTRIV